MANKQFQVLQDHLDSGFRILKYERKFGNYLFSLWEFGQPFIISVEDGEEVSAFIEGGSYRKYLLEEVMRCILLIDIVEFSVLENEQQLQKVIRLQCFLNDKKFRDYEIAEKVPMGDGAIITFSEANKLTALDYVKELHGSISAYNAKCQHPDKRLMVRMGINYGKVQRFTDINKIANIIGDGVNRCERVTSKGEAGHILASESAFGLVTENSSKFAPLFHDCGPFQDKHGIEFRIYNVYGSLDGVEIGVAKSPKKK